MEIEYKGANAIIISTKKGTVVVDPVLTHVGLKNVPVKGMIQVATEARFAVESDDTVLSIESPGEFGVANFDIKGVAAQRHLDTKEDPKHSTMYRMRVNDDVRVAVLGNIDATLTDDQLEALGVIDVLILPVGGNGYTLDATSAAAITRSVDPKVVIPVHYADSAVKYEVPQDTLETFTKELGSPVEETTKFKLKQSSALPQTLTIVTVTRS